MTIKLRSYIPYIIGLIVMFVLLLLLGKGCSNSRQAIAQNKELKIANDSLAAEVIRGKVELLKNKQDYDTQLEVANGQVELKDNQLTKTGDELDAANKRINILLAKHHGISPSTDTSITIVPNAYVEECSECFNELQNGQKLVQKYKSDVDQLNFEWHKKSILQTNRINQQEQEKGKLAKSLQDCMDISKSAISSGKPKGQLYFSWNVIWSPLPIGASVGFLYQNKRKMQYGLRWGYGTYGQAVETEINLPLSFKKR